MTRGSGPYKAEGTGGLENWTRVSGNNNGIHNYAGTAKAYGIRQLILTPVTLLGVGLGTVDGFWAELCRSPK